MNTLQVAQETIIAGHARPRRRRRPCGQRLTMCDASPAKGLASCVEVRLGAPICVDDRLVAAILAICAATPPPQHALKAMPTTPNLAVGANAAPLQPHALNGMPTTSNLAVCANAAVREPHSLKGFPTTSCSAFCSTSAPLSADVLNLRKEILRAECTRSARAYPWPPPRVFSAAPDCCHAFDYECYTLLFSSIYTITNDAAMN